MNHERRDKIIKEHPHLFAYPPARVFECSDGWLDIIEDLANKLEPLIVKWKEKNEVDELCIGPCASQIKEKYGTLRFYMLTDTDEMEKLIDEAEDRSSITCEKCGKPGILRGEHWYYTSCEECKKD
jgi:hypothetical protein